MVADDTRLICIRVVDNLLGANCTSRWAFSSIDTDPLHVWGYASHMLRYKEGFEFVNPELGKEWNLATAFLFSCFRIIPIMEKLEKKADLNYSAILAYFLIESKPTHPYSTDPFGKWVLEAITSRLKITLSRLHEQGKHNLKAKPSFYRILNQSAAGQALLPEEYHGFVWSKRREPTAMCLPHVICVDPLYHREVCWCGLIFQSVPLRIIQFYGVLDATDDKGSQWRDFVAEHCFWTRDLGETNIYKMHKNGRYRQNVQSAFQNHLRLVLEAFFIYANKWQGFEDITLTNRELMVDWETWRRRMFLAVLYITAEQFLITSLNHTSEKIQHADRPRNRVPRAAIDTFQLVLMARKIWTLRANSPGNPTIDALERAYRISLVPEGKESLLDHLLQIK